MYMVKITADGDWRIFPFITLKMNRMLIISCGSAELRGFCLPVMKIPAWKKNDFWNIVKTMNLKH